MDLSASFARSVCGLGDAPNPLATPGGFQMWVLERPLAPALLFVGAGVLLWFILRSQGKTKQGGAVAAGLALLGVGVFVTGALVETREEKLIARTRELVDAVASVNTTGVDALLASDAVVMPFGFPRDVILARLQSDLGGRYPIKEHSILAVRAKVDGPNTARTQVHVRVVSPESTLYAAPIGSWWMVTWRKDRGSGEWQVRELEMQQLDTVGDVSQLRP